MRTHTSSIIIEHYRSTGDLLIPQHQAPPSPIEAMEADLEARMMRLRRTCNDQMKYLTAKYGNK